MSGEKPRGFWAKVDGVREKWGRVEWLYKMAVGGLLFVFAIMSYLGYKPPSLVPEHDVPVPFNLLNGCEVGNLARAKDGLYLREVSLLDNGGARALTLCLTETFVAKPSNFALELANAYPGCLLYQNHDNSLQMVGQPKAVCRYPVSGGARYFCDGTTAESRITPAASELKDGPQLPVCASDFLTRIQLPPL